MNYYKPINFSLEELIYPELFKKLKDKQHIAWGLLDSRMLFTIDAIRKYFGKPVYVNSWDSGGELSLRGLRPFNTKVGAEFSTHKYGIGIDFTVKGIDSQEIRNHIKANYLNLSIYKYITCIEDFKGMNWVHIDFRNVVDRKSDLLIVSG